MGSMTASADVREAEIRAVVIRCGCGEPSSHSAAPCPTPRALEDRGIVSYYHHNPLRRLLFRVKGGLS